jgi:membrane protease YdiL (CAAX protease family)
VAGRRIRQARAIGLATVLVGWSGLVDPRLPQRWRPLVRAAVGAGLVRVTRTPMGLRPPALYPGLRLGVLASTCVALGVAAATGLPAVRSAMAARDLPAPVTHWLGWQIPLGTVWSEEATYRAALDSVAADAFGAGGGRLLQAAAFGLAHIADARSADAHLAGTVLVTGAAGWLFGWLRDRSGSLAAPMLAHLAINEAGAVAALAVQRVRSTAG